MTCNAGARTRERTAWVSIGSTTGSMACPRSRGARAARRSMSTATRSIRAANAVSRTLWDGRQPSRQRSRPCPGQSAASPCAKRTRPTRAWGTKAISDAVRHARFRRRRFGDLGRGRRPGRYGDDRPRRPARGPYRGRPGCVERKGEEYGCAGPVRGRLLPSHAPKPPMRSQTSPKPSARSSLAPTRCASRRSRRRLAGRIEWSLGAANSASGMCGRRRMPPRARLVADVDHLGTEATGALACGGVRPRAPRPSGARGRWPPASDILRQTLSKPIASAATSCPWPSGADDDDPAGPA